MVDVRRASLDDECQVFELFSRLESRQRTGEWAVNQESGVPVYRRIIDDSELGVILVSVEDSVVLGVLSLSYPISVKCSGKYARIEEYIVDDKARGKGVGTKLLGAAIIEASKAGCYDLQVNNPSLLGKAVYSKRGFIPGGEYWRMKL